MSWSSLHTTCLAGFLSFLVLTQVFSAPNQERSPDTPALGIGSASSSSQLTPSGALPQDVAQSQSPALGRGNLTQASSNTPAQDSHLTSPASNDPSHGPALINLTQVQEPSISSVAGSTAQSNQSHAPPPSTALAQSTSSNNPTPLATSVSSPISFLKNLTNESESKAKNNLSVTFPVTSFNGFNESNVGVSIKVSGVDDAISLSDNKTHDPVPVIEVGLFHFNSASSKVFYVPGNKIPFVTWNVGPSYAGMLPVSPAVIGGNITDDNHLGVSLNNPTTNVSVGAGGHEVPVGSKPPGIDINVGTHPSRLRLRSSSSDPTSTTIPLTSGSQRSNSTTEQIQDSSKKIFFWFFPATAVEGTNKLTLWVNGGPGCSSMIGALTESGPISWKNGRASPSKNIYSWTNSSSILYVEDNTGYSTSSSKSIEDLSKNILGFLKNWLRVFPEMSPMKLYITGEAYAGLTIPFIADYILSNPDEIPNKLKGLLLFNPVLTYDAIQMQVPTYPFIQYNQRFFRLNETTMAHLSKIHKDCGYEDYINKYLSFPPSVNSSAPAPTSIYDVDGHKTKRCDVWQYAFNAAENVNPSFNPYLISQTLQPFSILRLPATFNQSLPGQIESAYFDRKDVKKVLHAQSNSNWSSCSNPSELVPRQGFNPASTSTVVLAKVINKLKRTVIVHGSLDFRVISNGTLIALQNMTWGGTQGFQSPINLPFFVPGQGTLGKYNTERNLSFVELEGSGESVPESEPKASLMIFKYLIGDFNSISNSTENFKKTIMNNTNVPNLANQSVNFTSASLSSIGFSNSSNTSSNQTARDYSGVILSNSSTGTPKAYSPQTVDSTNLTLHLDSGSASPSVSANPRPGPSDTAVQPNSDH